MIFGEEFEEPSGPTAVSGSQAAPRMQGVTWLPFAASGSSKTVNYRIVSGEQAFNGNQSQYIGTGIASVQYVHALIIVDLNRVL